MASAIAPFNSQDIYGGPAAAERLHNLTRRILTTSKPEPVKPDLYKKNKPGKKKGVTMGPERFIVLTPLLLMGLILLTHPELWKKRWSAKSARCLGIIFLLMDVWAAWVLTHVPPHKPKYRPPPAGMPEMKIEVPTSEPD